MDDRELTRDILEELDFEPGLAGCDLGISVEGGVVTISGHVPTLLDMTTVRQIVETVRGVRAIVCGMEVRPAGEHLASDAEIARRVASTLAWTTPVPKGRVRVTVSGGQVTLRGRVDRHDQSCAAEAAVRRLIGVTGVVNRIRVVPPDPRCAVAEDVARRIRASLDRNAGIDASAIRLHVESGIVTLEGEVRQLSDRRAARLTAWSAPGIRKVIDRLRVI